MLITKCSKLRTVSWLTGRATYPADHRSVEVQPIRVDHKMIGFRLRIKSFWLGVFYL
ncbi:hypothetical protein [Saccharopolyspora mangrovi]|uniref:Uncharacterized protein n=1 Tax=Saccharopolyspora mangrovi TaxID=3082379 RepID=A0ABU6A7M6_9PSEU|nr:hypothetical protein [Saccharopolyspora sp. S2-29]MEB3367380.1 hypothetical protein [Saccharopolyspora sp. S2-29]